MAEVSSSKIRRSERHPIRMAVVLLTDSETRETGTKAFTVDLSQHGCRVEGNASLTQGQIVQMIPSDSVDTAIMGRVVWVGKPASDLAGEAGIEFLHEIPCAN